MLKILKSAARSEKILQKYKGAPKYCHQQATRNKYPKRLFSGIQPTGNVHLGNYFGAIQRWVELQNSGNEVLCTIADLHSITLPQDPKKLRENILLMTASLIACGIDVKKSILFQQSEVSMHTELNWILATITTMPRLGHLPQFKEKNKSLKNFPLGLYIYPVLQAADILLYKATHVPIGQDQIQHIQLAQDLARIFNKKFGQTFPIPHTLVSVTYQPETRPGVANLINIHSLLTGKTPDEICTETAGLNTEQYKLALADVVIDKLTPIREQILGLLKERAYLDEVLKEGSERATELATHCWLEVKDKVFGSDILHNIRNVKTNTTNIT